MYLPSLHLEIEELQETDLTAEINSISPTEKKIILYLQIFKFAFCFQMTFFFTSIKLPKRTGTARHNFLAHQQIILGRVKYIFDLCSRFTSLALPVSPPPLPLF